jgi:hypothetical protein
MGLPTQIVVVDTFYVYSASFTHEVTRPCTKIRSPVSHAKYWTECHVTSLSAGYENGPSNEHYLTITSTKIGRTTCPGAAAATLQSCQSDLNNASHTAPSDAF